VPTLPTEKDGKQIRAGTIISFKEEKKKMARRSYDRMYRNVEIDEKEEKTIEPAKVEEDSLPEVKEAEKKTNYAGKVIGGLNLNVRKEPKANAEVIDTVRDGASVIITEEVNDEWYHIASPNGYVMKRFVKI
jgi:uncharacterized protein YgiM (DUF1202 family)